MPFVQMISQPALRSACHFSLYSSVLRSVSSLAVVGGAALAVSAQTFVIPEADLLTRTYAPINQRSLPVEPVYGQFNSASFWDQFDNRDSQLQIAYDTEAAGITPGQGAASYNVTSVTIEWTAAGPEGAPQYDPTQDHPDTFDLLNRPALTPDVDAGRAMTLFGAGFRSGYTGFSFDLNDPSGAPFFGPLTFPTNTSAVEPFAGGANALQKGVRVIYPVDFDDQGQLRDVSNCLDETDLFDINNQSLSGVNSFMPSPFAVGTTADIGPGDVIADGTNFTFAVDVSDPFVLGYVQEALNSGELGFVLATLHPATGGPGGGSGNYPRFYMSDAFTAEPVKLASLTIELSEACPGDLNGDGAGDIDDISFLLNAILTPCPQAGTCAADLNSDGSADFFDVAYLLEAFDPSCQP